MIVMMVGCFIAAIAAMAFGLEYLSAVLWVAGMILGIAEERREQLRREHRETHRRLVDELRRHG